MQVITLQTTQVLQDVVNKKKHKAYKTLVKEVNKDGTVNLRKLRYLHDSHIWLDLARGVGCLKVFWNAKKEFAKGNLKATYTPTHITIHTLDEDSEDGLGVLVAEYEFKDVGLGVFEGQIPVRIYTDRNFYKGKLNK